MHSPLFPAASQFLLLTAFEACPTLLTTLNHARLFLGILNFVSRRILDISPRPRGRCCRLFFSFLCSFAWFLRDSRDKNILLQTSQRATPSSASASVGDGGDPALTSYFLINFSDPLRLPRGSQVLSF